MAKLGLLGISYWIKNLLHPLNQGYAYIFCLLFCQAGVNSHHPIGGKNSDRAHFFWEGLHKKWKLAWNTQREYYRMKTVNVEKKLYFTYIFSKLFLKKTTFWDVENT